MASSAVTNVGGLPVGGADNAILAKQSAGDYDADWVTSISLADGTAGAPSISFSSSATSGIFYSSGVSISVSGVETLSVTSVSVEVLASREFRIYNGANTFYAGLSEPGLTGDVQLTLPNLDGAILQIQNLESTLTVPTGAGDDNVALSDSINFYRLNPTGTRTITGFTGGYSGRVIILANVSAFNIDLAHQSTSSTTTNRIITQDGAALTIEPDEVRMLVYDGSASRWRTICGCGVNTISPPPPPTPPTPPPTPPTPPPTPPTPPPTPPTPPPTPPTPTPPTPPPTPSPTPPTPPSTPPTPPSVGGPPPPGPTALWPVDFGVTGGARAGEDVFGTSGEGQGLEHI